MNKAHVIAFAKCVGTKVETVSAAGWAACKCPLAPWLHDSGKDSNPSFAIEITKGESRFNCYTCESGDLLLLVQRLKELGAQAPKYRLKDAVDLLMMEDEEDLTLDIKEYDEPTSDAVAFHPYPEAWMESFLPAWHVPMAMKYLATREIDLPTIKALNLRFDTGRKTVCFPYRDFKGRLAGFRGRYVQPTPGQPSYHMYKNPKGEYNPQVWMGEDTVDFSKPVVMVESVFDYASVYRVYQNLVAPLTVGMSKEKVKRMGDALDIVTLFDAGKGGNKARSLITKHLPDSHIHHITPDEKDPGVMTPVQVIAYLAGRVPGLPASMLD